jgi:endonuclease/exonuclease/phosphatase family metal-dependent hydrolase
MLTSLTQNIWGGAPFWGLRRRPLARRIAHLRPDIIGLQEVHAPDTSGGASQAHELAGLVGGYHTVFAPGRVTPSGRCEGVAIMTSHNLRERQVCHLTRDRNAPLDRFGPRVVLRALVETPEGPVDAFVTHLSVSRRARANTVPELIAFARDRSPSSRGAVLLGDLTAAPDERVVEMLEIDDWIDTWKSANLSGVRGGTWPAIAPYRRIDYIFVQPAECWVVHSCQREPPTGSDHLGVLARLSPTRHRL